LWDRLEENRVSAYLFHLLVRKMAFHVELFMTKDEFRIFWEHHTSLPVKKLQLRYMHKDGMPHSACEEVDRVSADLFMGKKHRSVFIDFLNQHLPDVKLNPGKQSV